VVSGCDCRASPDSYEWALRLLPDELYFIATSKHLAFGYVDFAPLAAVFYSESSTQLVSGNGRQSSRSGNCLCGVIFAGGYLIRYLTPNLTAGIERPGEAAEQVKNTGMYIGWLERFLVG
jgi:hypothetical protein